MANTNKAININYESQRGLYINYQYKPKLWAIFSFKRKKNWFDDLFYRIAQDTGATSLCTITSGDSWMHVSGLCRQGDCCTGDLQLQGPQTGRTEAGSGPGFRLSYF